MAEIVYYVNPDGGADYLTLNAALTALRAMSWASVGNRPTIKCRKTNAASFDSTAVYIGTLWDLDATNYLTITADTGHEASETWNDAKYYLKVVSGTDPGLVYITNNFVRITKLQIWCNTTASPTSVIYTYSAFANIVIDSCYLRGGYNGVFNVATIQNCVVTGFANCGILQNQNYTAYSHLIYNNTVIGGAYGIGRTDAQGTTATVNVINNYCGNQTTAPYLGTLSLTTNAHSSATSIGGSTANVAYSAATFVNVTAGTENYKLAVGSALINAGTTIGSFAYDIGGKTRPIGASWDIGASEYQSGQLIDGAGNIASTEAVGTPKVDIVVTGSASILITDFVDGRLDQSKLIYLAGGIASDEAVGTPTVTKISNAHVITGVGGIASDEAVGTPTVFSGVRFLDGAPIIFSRAREHVLYSRKRQ